MEGISTTYIISQVFVIIMYTLVSLTYYVSNRKTLLIMSFCAIVSEAIGYTLLHAYLSTLHKWNYFRPLQNVA